MPLFFLLLIPTVQLRVFWTWQPLSSHAFQLSLCQPEPHCPVRSNYSCLQIWKTSFTITMLQFMKVLIISSHLWFWSALFLHPCTWLFIWRLLPDPPPDNSFRMGCITFPWFTERDSHSPLCSLTHPSPSLLTSLLFQREKKTSFPSALHSFFNKYWELTLCQIQLQEKTLQWMQQVSPCRAEETKRR